MKLAPLLRKCMCIVLAISVETASAVAPLNINSPKAPRLCRIVPPPLPLNLSTWATDDNYNLEVNTDLDGRLKVRVSGDLLRINQERFGTIVRSISQAIPNISLLTFDAREIIVDGPLSLRAATVEFLADTISFTPRAAITLTAVPTIDDGLRVVSSHLLLAADSSRPFQISLDPSIQRHITITTKDVTVGNQRLSDSDAQIELWNRTLDSYFADPPISNWTAVVGLSSEASIEKAFREEMRWPLYTSAKLMKFHTRAPYDADNLKVVNTEVNELRPLFEQWSDERPLVLLAKTENLVRLQLDASGKSAAYAPRIAILRQIVDLEASIEDDGKKDGYFSMLADLIVATKDAKTIDQQAIAKQSDRINADGSQMLSAQADIDASLTRIGSIKQQATALSDQISQRQATLAAETASDAERQKDAAAIKLGTNVLSAGVAIGCMFIPGAQVVGVAIATGINVSGGLIYAANAGQLDTATVVDVLKKGADFYSSMTAVSESWEKFKKQTTTADQVLSGQVVLAGDPPKPGEADKRKPISRVDAAKDWAAAAKGLGSAVSTAFDSLGIAKPTKLDGTDREKNDLELNDLLSQLGALNKEASDLAAEVTARTSSLTVLMSDKYDAVETLTTLQAADPVNSAELERWKSNALVLWQQHILDRMQAVITLRRSYFFETGQIADVPADVFQYPEELLAMLKTGLYDPTLSGTQSTPAALLRANLEIQQKRAIVSMTAIVNAVKNGLDATLAKRTEADTYRLTFPFRSTSTNPAERRFVQTVNSQLAHQIGFGRDPSSLPPVYIPIVWPALVTGQPQRFVDAKITKIKFRSSKTNLMGSGLTFTIMHPGYGEVLRGNQCFMFDLREMDAENVIPKTTDFGAINPDWAKAATRRIELDRSDSFYTYYPARTSFLLSTVVSGSDWKNVPEIEEIDIGIEVMQ